MVRTLSRVADVEEASWNACAGGDDPFVQHQFLRALEDSGSAAAETGWLPQHLVVEGDDGELLAAAPLYVKGHSLGEYVFDWGWADAYERVGLAYYPKLQCCVPFTPVTGPRLLVRSGQDPAGLQRLLLESMIHLAERLDLSSLHLTFPTEHEWDRASELGLLQRRGVQFHWLNRGYQSFDDFLSTLKARKRKAIKRERRQVVDAGVDVAVLRGHEISSDDWEAFYGFYRSTIDHKRWGRAYLSRAFFEQLGATMPEQLVLMVARQDGALVAGALHLLGGKALYGRYWGASRDLPFLHFELCYYRAIDLAIELGLERVEAGAQGPHKLSRGYVAQQTYSAHWLRHPQLRDAVAAFLEREREELRQDLDHLDAESPYREALGGECLTSSGRR